jgi:uncharacterized membrane protein
MVRRAHLALAGTRVVVGAAFGVLVFAAAAALTPWQVAVLVAWDAAAVVVVAWVLWVVLSKDAHGTAALATREDDSRAAADLTIVAACVASLAAVALGLIKASHMHGAAQAVVTAFAVLTVLLSWAPVHVVFTLRYARLYYAEGGGIDFNDQSGADYRDFLYLAFTIGMTYQVSDTDLTSKSVRRTALRHALLSYLFGTVVVAVMINVVAGLVR